MPETVEENPAEVPWELCCAEGGDSLLSVILLSCGHKSGFVSPVCEISPVGHSLAFKQGRKLSCSQLLGLLGTPRQQEGQGALGTSRTGLKIGPCSLRAGAVFTFSRVSRDSCSL